MCVLGDHASTSIEHFCLLLMMMTCNTRNGSGTTWEESSGGCGSAIPAHDPCSFSRGLPSTPAFENTYVFVPGVIFTLMMGEWQEIGPFWWSQRRDYCSIPVWVNGTRRQTPSSGLNVETIIPYHQCILHPMRVDEGRKKNVELFSR